MDHPAVDLLKSLMSMVSTSELEQDIGIFLERHLQGLGYTVERIAIAPGSTRHNVYAYLGSSRQTRILLTAHMDTVPPHIPLTVDGDVLRGRGSSDDLGPLAAQIVAAEELRKEGQVREEGGDIGLLFVVGEENGGHGMIAANDMGLTWESGIFAEPTENRLAKGHKGQHNIVAPSAKALCEVRMVSDLPGIKKRLEEIVARHENVELQFVFEYPEALLEWEIEGFDAAPVAFGTDIPRLRAEYCANRVLYGPGSILVAHGPDEFIRIPDLISSVSGYKRLVLHFLQKSQ
ncbi:unnamed protein product [Parascedosporium putredinis]|uniref:Peptidase M20 dimerisation domain-containing protein n=1 Tax=Parascedosporium putredinis TaxID=1442378 RepID=A0A9P1H3I8_9PEZI|nr:unnamed protein product [Parascedosporium putredinis]CAI7997077.1 unnamed protein product [Parascedosporium putredinis]